MPDHKRTQIRRLTYVLFIGLASWNVWVACVAFLSFMTGWGYAVSTAVKFKNTVPYEDEFGPFDYLAELIVGPNNPHAYGVVWLTLHGLTFGTLAIMVTGCPWFFIWGLMGLAYKVAKDWERGEIFYGLVQGASITLYLLMT